MTREDAIEVLQTEISCVKRQDCARISCDMCEFCLEESEILEAYEMAIAALREQPVTNCHQLNGWISVEDRLPEDKKDEYVLVVCDYHGKISVETRKKWNIDSSVTHWMPLPSTEGLNET